MKKTLNNNITLAMKPLLSILFVLLYQLAIGQNTLLTKQIKSLDSIATQDVPENAPGIPTAIIKHGKLIYEKYAGYADLTASILITEATRFNIASNGKQFTALAVLTLIDARKLKISDDIRTFFPDIFPEIQDRISIQSLLNHTSGIRDCYDLWSLQGFTWWEKSFSNNDVLKLIEKQKDLNFKPDSEYLYSNTNYILLALLIEKVSGKSFVEYTNAMFRKLNMPNTSFEDDHTKIRGQIARAYFNFSSWTTYQWIWNVCGDGNIFSTLSDQIQWEKLVHGKGATSIKRKLIKKSQQQIEGAALSNYGYGLEFNKYKGLDCAFHEGATGAWKATVTRFPGKKISFVTLTNTGKSIPSMQTRQMADVVFELKTDAAYLVTKPANAGKFVSDEEITGTYLTENDFSFQFEKRDDKLFLKRVGRNDVELEREADNIFHQKYDPAFKQEFSKNIEGKLQVTAYYTNHQPYSLTKQSADFSNFKFENLNGSYFNVETGTTIHIQYKADKTYNFSVGTNSDTSAGLLITVKKIIVNNYTLTFEPGTSSVETIYLNADRVRRIKFVRQ